MRMPCSALPRLLQAFITPNFQSSASGCRTNSFQSEQHSPVMGLMHLVPRAHPFGVYAVIKRLKKYTRNCKHGELNDIYARFLLGEFDLEVLP